ncbi:hypothetical protein ACIBG0_28945 [Nocardia sp. NPDC050630]|uniref:hypothetical protein n=1 Tax=Nocardia sp. NPDC050630 TaxID=3364321 RepID=UPI00379045A1
MAAQRFQTEEQVQQYLAQAFPSLQFEGPISFQHGWVCRPKLTPEEIARGMDLGLTSYVVNRETGVVTVHPSLHPFTIGEMYDQAIEAGQPVQGAQIYPHRTRTTIQRTHEDSETIQYQVRIESLLQPPEPTEEFQLIITKHPLSVRPTRAGASRTAAWAQWKSRQDGTWPEQGTFED